VPRYPDLFLGEGFDPDTPAGRFNRHPAIAIGFGGEYADGEGVVARDALREAVGGWVLDEQPELGRGRPFDGSAGRGAEGWVAVVQWAAEAVADNIVDIAIGYALARTIGRLRDRKQEREREGKFLNIEVSRGTAAALAAADVAEHFGEPGPLEVEAVEEPSGIAGYEVSELSYTGLEPWIVLLRNMQAEVRYIVVVLPDGTVAGRLKVPFLEFEAGYLLPSRFADDPEIPQARRRWLRIARRRPQR
jgi:hypothetical protein